MDHIETFKLFKREIDALSYALWLINWDSETEMPLGSQAFKASQTAVLNEKLIELYLNPKRIKALEELNKMELESPFKREIELEYKRLLKIIKIPKQEYLNYKILLDKANQIYKKAKKESNFSLFEPVLDEIIKHNKKLIKYLKTDNLKGYDVLLNDYHEGMKVEDYDEFFNLLKKKLVPFIEKIDGLTLDYPSILDNGYFKIEKQREFSQYLLTTLGYDLNHGLLKESVHPFTSGISSLDVRITTAYNEKSLQSAIFSTIHEMGHAIYEQQANSEYIGTIIEDIESLAMHESQSRLYENMLGRSYEYWINHYEKLIELFPEQLKQVSLDDFYKYINKVEKTFIRTDADELTYSIHIMIRYEIEKAIFNDNLPTSEIKKMWNKLYFENLGLKVKNDTEGILQDIHWSGGAFGYFPTYALGSAIAAQIYKTMNNETDVNKLILEGKTDVINDWLKENIHQHASYKTPNQIIKDTTEELFNPNYYVDYLLEKYKKLYNL